MTHGSVSFAWPGVRMITNNTKAFPPRTAVVSAVDREEKRGRFLYGLFSQPAASLWTVCFFFYSFYQQLKNNNRKAVMKTLYQS